MAREPHGQGQRRARPLRERRRTLQQQRHGDTPFASYELLRFSPKWMGDYGVLFLDAPHATLNAVWTQTVPDGPGGSATARIFLAAFRL